MEMSRKAKLYSGFSAPSTIHGYRGEEKFQFLECMNEFCLHCWIC